MISRRSSLVHLLSALFGISAWIAINGLWQQTPILVNQLPEAWSLASYITLITQLANVGPVIYSLLKRYCPSQTLESISIHSINLIGIVALILQIFFWDTISTVAGKEHSLAFLLLTFFLAIVDCTSSVLYVPFMSHLSSTYLVSHLVGQSLSGLIPSFLALGQGVGGNPDCISINGTLHPVYPEARFSVNVFFLLLTFLAFLSWLAFFALEHLRGFFGIDVRASHTKKTDSQNNWPEQSVDERVQESPSPTIQTALLKPRIAGKTILTLLICEAAICCITNGILPSIQPYSVLVYGNVAYHFVVSLSAISSASGTFLSSFLNRHHRLVLPICLTVALASALYILASALTSPSRLITGSFGSVFIVLIWMSNNCLFSFSRATIMRLLRSQPDSHRYLFLGGVFTQIGSAIGAITMFGIINYTKAFQSFSPC